MTTLIGGHFYILTISDWSYNMRSKLFNYYGRYRKGDIALIFGSPNSCVSSLLVNEAFNGCRIDTDVKILYLTRYKSINDIKYMFSERLANTHESVIDMINEFDISLLSKSITIEKYDSDVIDIGLIEKYNCIIIDTDGRDDISSQLSILAAFGRNVICIVSGSVSSIGDVNVYSRYSRYLCKIEHEIKPDQLKTTIYKFKPKSVEVSIKSKSIDWIIDTAHHMLYNI